MLGGFGSIQSMITSLRNNRNLLRNRKKLFQKDFSFAEAKALYQEKKRILQFKESTPAQLATIREEIRKERRRNTFVYFIAAFFAAVVVGFIGYKVFSPAIVSIKQNHLAERKQEAMEKERKFLFYVTDGDTWFEKGRWHNAIYQYRLAVNLYPADFNARYRLAQALVQHCVHSGEDCRNARITIKQLIKEYPENKALLQTEATLRELPGAPH